MLFRSNGCASSRTLVAITITPSTNNIIPISACDSYSWNGVTYTTSGTYAGSTTNCVTEVLELTITPSTNNITPISACDSYSWNGVTYTTSGTYTGSTTNCVTEVLELTITPSTSITTNVTATATYTWAVNGTTYTASGNYSSANGCNTQNLVLTIVPIDNSTTLLNGVITSNEGNATYQWIDCSTNQPIVGATSQSFTPTVAGDYQVAITVNGVTILSACVNVVNLGIATNSSKLDILLYPNPSEGVFFLKSPIDLNVEVYNDLGQLILSQKSIIGINTVDLSINATGVYFLRAIDGKNENTFKLIKK